MGQITAKEKASELFNNIFPLSDPKNDSSFKDNMNRKIHTTEICLLIVDEILKVLESGNLYMEQGDENCITSNGFWLNVKEELEKGFKITKEKI